MAEKPTKVPARLDPFEEDWLEAWSPFREIGRPWRLAQVLNEGFGRRARGEGLIVPDVDIAEDDEKYVVTAEIPGTSKEDVAVETENNVLTIRGEKRHEREGKKEQSRWKERVYGSFSRSFTLPNDAAVERVNASFKDGVLTVEIPKSEEAKPKLVSIK
jgi:HSP20 family protein